MEQLLNKLIEKGWTKKAHHLYGLPNRPFIRRVKDSIHWVEFYYYEWWDNEAKLVKIYSLRDIVSVDSGLWQFVCENRMVKKDDGHIARIINLYKSDEAIVDGWWNCYYWLMICSTLDESELESFILDNIKIDG